MQAQVSFQDRLAEAVLLDRGVQRAFSRCGAVRRDRRAATLGLLAAVLRVSAAVARPRPVASSRRG